MKAGGGGWQDLLCQAGKEEPCSGRETGRETEKEMGGRGLYFWNGFLASVINASFVLIGSLVNND